MKLSTVAASLNPVVPALRCPRCGEPLTLSEGRSLLCGNAHCFDLSAKGYANLAPDHNQSKEKYDTALFESRSRVFDAGFYAPVANALCRMAERALPAAPRATPNAPDSNRPLMVDVGCGEGYYARALAELPARPRVIGLDLSRDAILAAARQSMRTAWLVADLTRLPLADHSVDVLIDVLTPADYGEFARVLKPGGALVKVIPADDYLVEVRAAVADRLQSPAFSNQRVTEHLQTHATVLAHETIRHTLPLTPEQADHFLRMTPMTFGLDDSALAQIQLDRITVAMELFLCRMN